MTKRFSINAADVTQRLEQTQAKLRRLRKKVQDLEQQERADKAFLLDFYDQGKTLVSYREGPNLEVSLSQHERFSLDQEAARRLIEQSKKRVPYARTVITSLQVRKTSKE